MNCPNCGKELNPGDKFCIGCGARVDGGASDQAGAAGPVNNFNNAAGYAGGNQGGGISFGSSKTMIRRYFFGFSDLMWLSVVVWIIFTVLKAPFKRLSYYGVTSPFATFCTVIQVIAVLVFLAAIGLTIYIRFTGAGKNNVDMATQNSIEMLKARAFSKFNVDSEQVAEVEPIKVAGVGASPDGLGVGAALKFKHLNTMAKIFTKDPVEAYRIGMDGVPRYLLVQATVYAFTDTQLLVYSGNVDISTGTIYEESVAEIFYKDVNGVTQLDQLKKFKAGIFRKQYYNLKYVDFNVCGITKTASFDSRFAPNAEASLAGMESYIREKKF